MPLPAYDRWERKLIARGGYQKKRCGRYTKPGLRLRAVEVDEAEPVEVLDSLNVKDYVPGRKQCRIIYDTGTTGGDDLYTYGGGWATSASTITTYNTTGSWVYTTDTTSTGASTIWTVPTTWVQDTGSGGWVTIPAGTRFETYEDGLTPEQRQEIERQNRRNEFQQRIRRQITGGEQRYDYYDKRHHADFSQVSQPEIVALQLLKKMLPVDEWRRYLRYAFVVVHSEITGLDYQVFRGGGHIRVFRRGAKVAELCIHISDRKCPPTDRVIAKKIMLEASELDVWLKSNVHCCRELGYKKPKIEDLIALGAKEGLIHNVAAEQQQANYIFTPEAVRRSQQPVATIQLAI